MKRLTRSRCCTVARRRNSLPGRKGAVTVLAAVLMIPVLAFAAFSLDLGYISLEKQKLQNSADAAVHAAVQEMLFRGTDEDDLLFARQAAIQLANLNSPDGGEVLAEEDVIFGVWDFETRSFTETTTDPNAVKVVLRRSAEKENSVNLFVAPVIGHKAVDLSVTSIASIGDGEIKDVMLDIDTSGSMRNYNRMTYTKEASLVLTDELRTHDRLGMTIFSYPEPVESGHGHDDDDDDGESYEITGHLENAFSSDFDEVRNRIPDLRPSLYWNTTDIAGGMRVALDELRNNRRTDPITGKQIKQYLVLLTDGHANESEAPGTTPENSIAHYNNVAQDDGVIIHGITLGANADKDSMRQAAELTGGMYFHVEDGDFEALKEVFKNIGRGNGVSLVQ